jgi:putative Mn2+ efflux pump MntP
MGILEMFVIGIGLAMDAFAVSICKGLGTVKLKIKHMIIAGLWFGGFQALMPAIGYFIGSAFSGFVKSIDHWVAFILLSIIGANMLKEAYDKDDEAEDNCCCQEKKEDYGFRTMIILAIATSIDALAVGVTMAFLETNIVYALFIIGITTFIIAAIGIKIGNIFGSKYMSKAEFAGGIILILIGVKILIEHLFF